MIVLDTSALIRFFTSDDKIKLARVQKLFLEEDLELPEVILPELEYVLSKQYNLKRDDMANIYQFLMTKGNISVGKEAVLAVSIFVKTNLDMADCLIAAHARGGTLASFDKKLLTNSGCQSYW